MLISESKLRAIIRDELSQSKHERISEQSPVLAMGAQTYLSEPSAQGLTATQKASYVSARTALGATPTGARAFALGKADHGANTFSFDGGLIPSIHPATARQMSSVLAPITDSTIYSVASIFDPIAITSWPSLYNAWARYSNDKSAVNALLMMLAVVGCVPLLSSVIKGSKIAVAALRSRAALSAVGKTSSTVQKIKALAQCFGSAPTKWVDLISELAPYSDEIAQQLSKLAGSGGKITGPALMRDLTEIATMVDKYNVHFKYINYIASNASQSVQEFLIGRFGPKVSKEVDAAVATAALEVEKASGIKLPTVASVPAVITQGQNPA